MPQHIDDLYHSLAVDNDVAVSIDERKILICIISGKHQLEARSVVGDAGIESVSGCLQQVDVRAGEIVD